MREAGRQGLRAVDDAIFAGWDFSSFSEGRAAAALRYCKLGPAQSLLGREGGVCHHPRPDNVGTVSGGEEEVGQR
eukprot:11671851-Karenia_brevis.AAC.1